MVNELYKLSRYLAYPLVITVSLFIYFSLISTGLSFTLSGYLAAIVGGLGMITYLELKIPYRKEWLPDKSEVKTDLLFMFSVQVFLPYFLSLLVITSISDLSLIHI